MNALSIGEQSGDDVASEQIEAAWRQHWAASVAGNQDLEHIEQIGTGRTS